MKRTGWGKMNEEKQRKKRKGPGIYAMHERKIYMQDGIKYKLI
jgi:hypothetical protein